MQDQRSESHAQNRAALAGFAALLASIGLARFGFSPLIPAMVQQHWVTAGQAPYLGATNLAGYLLGSALAPLAARRIAVPWLVRGATAAVALSFLAEAVPLGLAWHLGWRLLAGIAGGFAMVAGLPAVMAATPARRRGRAGGILMAALGLGMVLSGTLVPPLAAGGVAQAWLLYAALAALAVPLAWHGLAATMPLAAGPAPRTGRAEWLSIIAYAGGAAGFVPHTVFWADFIARGLGQGLGVAGLYWVALGLAACLVPLASGLIAERLGFTASFRAGLLLALLALLLPMASTAPAALLASSIIGGGIGITLPALASGRALELVGPARHRGLWARMTVIFAAAYAGTAYALSWLFARTLSYEAVFACAAALLLAGTLIEWLGMHHTKDLVHEPT